MTSVVTTLLLSLVITSNTSLIMSLNTPRVTTLSHLPSCLSWSVSCLYSNDPTRVSCFVTTSRSQNVPRAQRKRFSPPNRVHCAISTCAPRHSKIDSTHRKCAEGSLCDVKMRAAPQRERFDPPKVRRGFASHAQKRTAPQRERLDPPKVRRGFASRSQNVHRATARAIGPAQSAQMCSPSQNVHRATARAISLSQSDVPATKSTPRRPSTAPAAKCELKAPKCRACHEIQPKRSKVLRLSHNLPQTQNHPNCWTCHEIQL